MYEQDLLEKKNNRFPPIFLAVIRFPLESMFFYGIELGKSKYSP